MFSSVAPGASPSSDIAPLRPQGAVSLPPLSVGIAVVIGSGATSLPTMIDSVSARMFILALCCVAATCLAMPSGWTAGRWRWLAALLGWVLWAGQWAFNMIEMWLLDGQQLLSSLCILASRIAFIVAFMPLAGPNEPSILRWLDALLGGVFAFLLALLSWPGLSDGAIAEPDRLFLYFGYAVMAILAGIGLATQRSRDMRNLSRAMLVTLVLYGTAAVTLREGSDHGVISAESTWYILGDFAFLAYLALLPARNEVTEDVDASNSARRLVGARLVPLLIALMAIGLAFAAMRIWTICGVAGGMVALLAYAGRTTVTETHHRRLLERAFAVEQERARLMIDFMHEVRSPLSVVALNSSLLRRTGVLDEAQSGVCSAIDAGCDSVRRLLDDMLSLERAEAGLDTPKMARHDITALVNEVINALYVQWQEAGVLVNLRNVALPLEAIIDRMAVLRILLNLVDNAIRFTPRGGTVSIHIAREPERLVLSVEDDGVGMTMQQQQILFRRFSLVGRPQHGKRGIGLGLSICRALAHGMDGDIIVRSSPGEGTMMSIILPQDNIRSWNEMEYTNV